MGRLTIILLLFELIVQLVLSDDFLWTDLMMFNNETAYKALPYVFIIPLPAESNTKCKGLITDGIRKVIEHSHDMLFHNFLLNSYEKRSIHRKSAYLYFYPVYTRCCHKAVLSLDDQQEFWVRMDKHLELISKKKNFETFVLDRVFLASTHPLDVPRGGSFLNPAIRNVLDVRFIRVDNTASPNARDVYVPYIVDKNNFQNGTLNSTLSRRKYFFYAPCKATRWKDDVRRPWRTSVYEALHDYPYSLVTLQQEYEDYINSMKISDFCFVLPGDTISTSKLYMYIFSGCIPVIFISFRDQLPFGRLINWNKFSIIVMKDVALSMKRLKSVVSHLEAVRKNEKLLTDYKRNLFIASRFFDYNNTEWPSVYHLTLLELGISSGCGVKSLDYPGRLQNMNQTVTSNFEGNLSTGLNNFICGDE